VVLMLIAGFAPYVTYKAISFMGFDIYHAMSAEQEAKSALNRPMPIPLSRRGRAEPPKVLNGDGVGGGSGQNGSGPAPVPVTPTAGGPSSTPSGASSGASAGGAAAGAGAVAAGVVVAKEAAAAGPRFGNFVADSTSEHVDSPSQTPAPSAMPPDMADPTPPARTARKE
jgi:hypothetical protein